MFHGIYTLMTKARPPHALRGRKAEHRNRVGKETQRQVPSDAADRKANAAPQDCVDDEGRQAGSAPTAKAA